VSVEIALEGQDTDCHFKTFSPQRTLGRGSFLLSPLILTDTRCLDAPGWDRGAHQGSKQS
jgi:hypothetical protein